MFWFLPLLLGGLGGFLAGYITAWVIDYLDKQALKEHIQQQEKQKFKKEVSRTLGKTIKKTFKNQEYRKFEIDWVLEDEESRKIFAGRYYDGEVVSMEEVQAQEIDPELQWELDNQEIVIL